MGFVMNIYQHIARYRDDGGFSPKGIDKRPTSEVPGPSKVDVLRARATMGVELWHPEDAADYDQQQRMIDAFTKKGMDE